MKGIIVAVGSGTRLYPITASINKQLLPVYDKPMIYYPLSVLMLANIKEILVISTRRDLGVFKKLLGDGSKWGIYLQYEVQLSPDGLAQAFIIGEKFIGNDSVCLVIGDNIFYGQGFSNILQQALKVNDYAVIFSYQVKDPQRYSVIEFDKEKKPISIEYKPKNPKSNFAVTGLYFYDNVVIDIAKKIKPLNRGELEITSINEDYLRNGKLKVELLGRGFAWLDVGTYDSLIDAGHFIQTIEHRQGYKIACLEEIAYNKGWINKDQVLEIAKPLNKSSYGKYLLE